MQKFIGIAVSLLALAAFGAGVNIAIAKPAHRVAHHRVTLHTVRMNHITIVKKSAAPLTEMERGQMKYITQQSLRQANDPNMPPQLRETPAQYANKVLADDHKDYHRLEAFSARK